MNRVLSSGFGPSSYPSPSDIRSNFDPLPPAVQMTVESKMSAVAPEKLDGESLVIPDEQADWISV